MNQTHKLVRADFLYYTKNILIKNTGVGASTAGAPSVGASTAGAPTAGALTAGAPTAGHPLQTEEGTLTPESAKLIE